jgi:hypothetical protein
MLTKRLLWLISLDVLLVNMRFLLALEEHLQEL